MIAKSLKGETCQPCLHKRELAGRPSTLSLIALRAITRSPSTSRSWPRWSAIVGGICLHRSGAAGILAALMSPGRTMQPINIAHNGAAHRHWFSLALRAAGLMLRPGTSTAALVAASYDGIADGYDEAWTGHMRDLSAMMLDRLSPPAGTVCIDLTCGTGFVTSELAARTGTRPIGVDASAGMIKVARAKHGAACDFVQDDVLHFLRRLADQSVDVITCGWGLGYSRPAAVVGQIARVLRKGGRVGVIDNTLFSLAEVLWASMKTFAERPAALTHAMNVRFLPASWALATLCRFNDLHVRWQADGSKSYHVPDGRSAVERLRATGAAAGFEFACDASDQEAIFSRFAQLIDAQRAAESIAITHRWLAVVGVKP